MSTNTLNSSLNSESLSNDPYPKLIQNLRAISLIADTLMRCESVDQVFRQTVELVRLHFAIERCAIFTVEGSSLRGTYGTTIAGHIVHEHLQLVPLDQKWESRLQLLQPQDSRWIAVNETRRTWDGENAAPLTQGWIAVTPIYSGNTLIGIVVNDCAITNANLDPAIQEVLAVLCSLLGSIIERKRAEDALREANEELESRVRERTIELEKANESLQAEIVDRQGAQDALAKERTLLRTLIDHIPDYIFIKNVHTNFLISNIAHAQSVGAEPEELIGKSAYDFYPEELAEQFDADDRNVMQSGEAVIGVERITLDTSGNRIWASTTKVPLRDQEGKVIGLVGISRNITARKEVEIALRQSEERYRILTELISDYAFSSHVEIDGTFVTEWDTKDSFTRLTGYSPEEIHNTFKLYHPDDVEAVRQQIQEMLNGQSSSQECRIITKDGSVRWLMIHRRPVWDGEQNRVVHYYGVGQDITERKLAEEALANERTLLRTIIDTVPNLIWMKDVDGRFVFANQFWADREHTTPDSIIGKTDFDINPLELAEKYRADDRKVLEIGESIFDIEELNITGRGEPSWLLTTKVPIRDAQGQITGIVGVARDITERKKAQEALANERTLLRTVIDALPIMMWMKDREGRFLLVNRFCMTDRETPTQEEWIGKTDFDIHPLDLAQKYQVDDQRVIQSGQSFVDMEELNISHRGEQRWLLTTKVPLRDSQGQITGIVGVARDITDRKQAQEALANERTLLRTIIDTLPHFIWVKNVEGRFVLVNKYSEMDREGTTLGKTDFDLHPLESAQKFLKDDQQVLESGISLEDIEEVNVSPLGEQRWVLTTKVPLRDAQGNIAGLVGVARDITDRKHVEDALRMSEERYRSLVELSPDGIGVLVNQRFVFVNKATVALFGSQNDADLLNHSLTDFVCSTDLKVLQTAFAQVSNRHESSTPIELQIVKPDGQNVHCDVMITPATFSGQPAVQIIIRNVSERVQAELLRRESELLRIALEKEQELGGLKSNLMTTLSHELRTPLTIIQSSTEFLDKYFYRLNEEQRQVRLRNIQLQVKKLTQLAEDISFLIRGTMDYLAPRFEIADLEQFCQGIIEEMEFFSEPKRKVDFIAEGNLHNVQIDSYLVSRIITNLLSNALKYSAESEEVRFTLRKSEEAIVIEVSDSGIGIPEADKEHLFEIFHRGSNVGYISGTGVGLAIVREAVAVHDGTITVESQQNIGTTFTVTLPSSYNGSASA